ncbi:hypothetical protein ACNKHR_14090 [Shigella flexneri]
MVINTSAMFSFCCSSSSSSMICAEWSRPAQWSVHRQSAVWPTGIAMAIITRWLMPLESDAGKHPDVMPDWEYPPISRSIARDGGYFCCRPTAP